MHIKTLWRHCDWIAFVINLYFLDEVKQLCSALNILCPLEKNTIYWKKVDASKGDSAEKLQKSAQKTPKKHA